MGIPDRVILEGRSMGGCIATHLAEQENAGKLYDGVLAIGAALLAEDLDPAVVASLPWTHQPNIPVLYLTNESETYASYCFFFFVFLFVFSFHDKFSSVLHLFLQRSHPSLYR